MKRNIIACVLLLGCGGSLGLQTHPNDSSGARYAESDEAGGAEYSADFVRERPASSYSDDAPSSSESMAMSPVSPSSVRHADSSVTVTKVTRPTSTPTQRTTTVVEIAPPPIVIQEQYVARAAKLTAASVGDHDRRQPYQQYLRRHPMEQQKLDLDMSRRLRFRVMDSKRRPLNDVRVVIDGVQGAKIQGRTHSDGVWDFFPGIHGNIAGTTTATVIPPNGQTMRVNIEIPRSGDGQDIAVVVKGSSNSIRVMDLAFVIDVTGSMEDELRYINSEVASIVTRIHSQYPEVTVRVGAVLYRDRTDDMPIQHVQLTKDVAGFAQALRSVVATGGGDYPEDMNAGLWAAMEKMSWSKGNASRVMVMIADAPPKKYASNFTYKNAMIKAAADGIRLLPVAASGADREVEYLFRAMATSSTSPYLYLTDDSGIGNGHMEADTDRVAVEYFAEMLSRLLLEDLSGKGMHEPGVFKTNAI